MLQERHRFQIAVVAHRKGRRVLAKEGGQRGGRHVFGGAGQHLQTARAVFVLHLGQRAHHHLAVRAVGEDEGEDHRLAFVLGELELLALAQD